MSTSVPNFVKTSQIAAELLRFSVFQIGGQPPSWILLSVKNDVTVHSGLSMSTTVPNFVMVTQPAAELLHFVEKFKIAIQNVNQHWWFCFTTFYNVS